MSAGEDLLDAVARHDVAEVTRLLTSGADPNHRIDPGETLPEWQPNTPLRMVVFRISDSLLDDEDLADFEAIAELLLLSGADPNPARALAELRYGPFDPSADTDPFRRVVSVVVTAAS
ncbi:MAG: hypothetical protein P0Y60_05075 [Candidatus Microbacterium colombiense]|nr:MAG: hypothetical protein P0Y60_05075 [Microbacterium sp.]